MKLNSRKETVSFKYTARQKNNNYDNYTQMFSGVASYGALGHVPPSTSNNFILVSLRSRLNLRVTIQILCSLRDQLVQMSTTHSSFDQFCISHRTISHRAAAAPGPESIGVARGCNGCTCTPQGGEKKFSGLIYRKNV